MTVVNRSQLPRRPRFMEEDTDEPGLPVNPEQQALQRVFGQVGAGAVPRPTTTGVAGGIDPGAPMKLPGVSRPNGSVVSTGPNTTNPGGSPGLEMGQGSALDMSGAVSAPPPATGGRTGWAGTSGTGLNLDAPAAGNSGAAWTGFNDQRAMAGGDPNSVKDAFFRWTQGLNFNPAGQSKEQIGEFLRSQIGSAGQYGINILDVQGDQILVETAERGPEWIDVVVNAGGQGASPWAWQDQPGATGGGAPPGVDMQTGGGLQGLDGLPSGLLEALTAEGGAGDDELLRQIQAELDALTRGKPSPLTQTTLQQLLGGGAPPAPVR